MGRLSGLSTKARRAPATVKSKDDKRDYLTPAEVDRLMVAAGKLGRHRHRDRTLLLIAYRHGLRAGELVALRWDQIDFTQGLLRVNRLKGGVPSTHPLRGPEIRALRGLQRESDSPYVFVTERGGPLTTGNLWALVRRIGKAAGFPFAVHPHQLRHACGYKLANEGHDTRSLSHYLGHANIQNTMHYTQMAPDRFKDFWKD
jgi:type 1 fimbriae regulatory protein FimE